MRRRAEAEVVLAGGIGAAGTAAAAAVERERSVLVFTGHNRQRCAAENALENTPGPKWLK